MLTSDDIISMHKAMQNVIDDMARCSSLIDYRVPAISHVYDRINEINQAVTALATVQRDLLKSLLHN